MPRVRLGVVLLVPGPVAAEIDGMRRALGDRALGRIPPHITLVPPVNVNTDRFDDALARVRAGAAATRPLALTLGPPASFQPVNPVLYLAVGGDTDGIAALRRRVFVPPLERSVDHDFVPHVTLSDGLEAERLEAGLVALASFEAAVTVVRVHVLSQRPDRVWEQVADAPFAPPAVVGRGGLPVELTVSDTLERGTAAVGSGTGPFAVTARRDGRVLGWATGSIDAPTAVARLHELTVGVEDRREGVGSRLLAAVESLAAERDCVRLVAVPHPFLERHGWSRGGERRLAADAEPAPAPPGQAKETAL